MSTETLILELSGRLAPVRRRSVGREAASLLALGAAELALLLMCGVMRPDLAQAILRPVIAWKIGSLAILAVVSCTIALRSFGPSSSSRGARVLLPGLAACAMIGAAFVASAADNSRSLTDRLSASHGILCAVAIVVLALPIMALLAVLMRRGAPVRPTQAAWTAGIGASSCGALIFTACCPANDPLYIVVWYSAAIAAVTAAARWLLPRRFHL